MLKTFLQVISIVFTLGAAGFLAKGNLAMSPKIIAELGNTKWGQNDSVIHSLSTQYVDTWIGFSLLIFVFLAQILYLWLPVTMDNMEPHKGSIVYTIVFAVFVLIGLYFVSGEYSKSVEYKTKQYISTNKIQN